MSDKSLEQIIKELSEPFPAKDLQWRPGSVSKDKKRAQALAFLDPRLYYERLDNVCAGEWEMRFTPWGESRIICELTIQGFTKSSTGEMEKGGFAPGTSCEAQAMKRACTAWGLARYLYSLPTAWVDYDGDKGRLLETPYLPEKFLPAGDTPAPPRGQQQEVQSGGKRLDKVRAEAMQRELEKLGFSKQASLKLASDVTGRAIRTFQALSEEEATETWNTAKRQKGQ